jgi:hypothetical protein
VRSIVEPRYNQVSLDPGEENTLARTRCAATQGCQATWVHRGHPHGVALLPTGKRLLVFRLILAFMDAGLLYAGGLA